MILAPNNSPSLFLPALSSGYFVYPKEIDICFHEVETLVPGQGCKMKGKQNSNKFFNKIQFLWFFMRSNDHRLMGREILLFLELFIIF